ncbi:hypothetical protein GOODEAATRI_018703 [Goodea atripinnis]|uniref:C2H2-type domain-containing protein n=1 Tax=Goodea atripinnis TaxID=208336 RepID=A0ABV0PZ57_9TELE
MNGCIVVKNHTMKVLCETCKRLFNNTWFLHLHELRVHSGEKRYLLCPREGCDRKFTRRFKLESHLLGDHEGKKPFTCAYAGCGKSFPLKVRDHFSMSIKCCDGAKPRFFKASGPIAERQANDTLEKMVKFVL